MILTELINGDQCLREFVCLNKEYFPNEPIGGVHYHNDNSPLKAIFGGNFEIVKCTTMIKYGV